MVSIGKRGRAVEGAIVALMLVGQVWGQGADGKPLPEVNGLMHEVEVQQRAAELKERDYLYRQTVRTEELDGRGGVKKTHTEVADVFWLEGVRVRRVVSKDGKALSADEMRRRTTGSTKR